MAHDHELSRLNEKIKTLTEEQSHLTQRILQSRRDEQRELAFIRNRFNSEIHQMEERQRGIAKDMERKERELYLLQQRIHTEQEEEREAEKTTSGRHRRHRI